MVSRKEKKDKLVVRPEERGHITTRRPFDLWMDMDHLFDSFRSNLDDLLWPWGQRSGPLMPSMQRAPPMDLVDMGNRYEARLEMPGISKENVDIQVTPNNIEIKAECSETKEEKDKNWVRRECNATSFYRALEFPEEIKTDDVDAELKDGILTINLPKVEPKPDYKSKKIKIN